MKSSKRSICSKAGNQSDQRRPSLWRFVFLGVALPLAAIAFFLGDDAGLREETLLAVCAGIAASAIWWAIFARYAESEAKRVLTDELGEQHAILDAELKTLRGMLVEEIVVGSRRWREQRLPRDVYPATEGFDLRFNRDIDRDLAHSSFYFFSGPSGVYVPARIELRPDGRAARLEEIRVRMLDPTSHVAMQRTERDRKKLAINAAKESETVLEEIRADLALAHVALWNARRWVYGPIRISYESAAVVRRLELFEDAVYDSGINREDKEEFPQTVAWGSRQPTWLQAREDFGSQEFSYFEIRPETSAAELEAQLDKLHLGIESIDECLERYAREYLGPMRQQLQLAREHVSVISSSASGPEGQGNG